MKYLPKPTDTALDAFLTCIGSVKNKAAKTKFNSMRQHIAAAATQYENAASTSTLHTIQSSDSVAGIPIKKEMRALYKQKMASKGSIGNGIYERIKGLPRFKRCPLCNQNIVATLDHHLPQVHYPIFAVLPINLVPACRDCNTAKKAKVLRNSTDQTMHPYYDNCEGETWLTAHVVQTNPPTIIFSVQGPPTWSQTQVAKAQFHFNVFGLATLYTSNASGELAGKRSFMADLFSRSGADGVRDHLKDEAKSHRDDDLNSWKTAMYAALSNNSWYWSNGF